MKKAPHKNNLVVLLYLFILHLTREFKKCFGRAEESFCPLLIFANIVRTIVCDCETHILEGSLRNILVKFWSVPRVSVVFQDYHRIFLIPLHGYRVCFTIWQPVQIVGVI